MTASAEHKPVESLLRPGRTGLWHEVGKPGGALVFQASKPVLDLKCRVARQPPPQGSSLELLEPSSRRLVPRLSGREQLLYAPFDALFMQVGRVPQPDLGCSGAEPEFEHIAQPIGPVAPATVPETVVQYCDGASGTGQRHLAGKVLVAPDVGLVDATEVAAGYKERAAGFGADRLWVVHELDVERGPQVDDCICVQVLGTVARLTAVDRVVVIDRVRAERGSPQCLARPGARSFATGRGSG